MVLVSGSKTIFGVSGASSRFLGLPIAVALVMKQAGIGAGVGLILLLICLWFALMLRFAQMPEHS